MTFQEFVTELLPVENHLNNGAAMGGLLFETHGKEEEFVKSQPVENVWTVVECEDDSLLEQQQEDDEVIDLPTIP